MTLGGKQPDKNYTSDEDRPLDDPRAWATPRKQGLVNGGRAERDILARAGRDLYGDAANAMSDVAKREMVRAKMLNGWVWNDDYRARPARPMPLTTCGDPRCWLCARYVPHAPTGDQHDLRLDKITGLGSTGIIIIGECVCGACVLPLAIAGVTPYGDTVWRTRATRASVGTPGAMLWIEPGVHHYREYRTVTMAPAAPSPFSFPGMPPLLEIEQAGWSARFPFEVLACETSSAGPDAAWAMAYRAAVDDGVVYGR